MKARSPYIVGRAYDWIFFLTPPLAALLVGIVIADTSFSTTEFDAGGGDTTGAGLFIGVLIHAHLVAVFFRSHGNRDIFRLHPVRFVVVPIVLFAAIVFSSWIAVASMVVATFWDVWHSGAQTFGFARIYDRNHGSPAHVGRRLDFWMNQLLYAGPILAGATLMDHLVVLEEFEVFEDGFSNFLILVPAKVNGRAATLTWLVVGAGCAFIAYYVYANYRQRALGHTSSPFKIWLIATTGLCSILTWGFNSWGDAFFIMNAFHAVQYLALVWAMEGKALSSRLSLSSVSYGRALTLVLFVGSVFVYGLCVELVDPDLEMWWAVTMVVSLMHFWYDAFIWSVRKRQI